MLKLLLAAFKSSKNFSRSLASCATATYSDVDLETFLLLGLKAGGMAHHLDTRITSQLLLIDYIAWHERPKLTNLFRLAQRVSEPAVARLIA